MRRTELSKHKKKEPAGSNRLTVIRVSAMAGQARPADVLWLLDRLEEMEAQVYERRPECHFETPPECHFYEWRPECH